MKIKILAIAGCMALGSTGAAHANYLVNGSFETGDLNGWTPGGNTSFIAVTNGTYDTGTTGAQDGNYFVDEGPAGSDGLLSQTFNDVAGRTLQLSGWVIGNGSSPSDVNFIFNGVTVLGVDPVAAQGWTKYSVNVTSTGNDTFTVGFRNDSSFDGLDNFSVNAVPEPEPYALMLAGLGLLGVAGRRRKKAA